MGREVYQFSVTVPSGTAITAPATTQMRMPPRVVEHLRIVVPPGPRGEVGFRVGSSGTQLLPITPGTWLVTDNERIDWDPVGSHDSGSWELVAYNTGQFDHTLYVRFDVELPGVQLQQSGGPLPLDQVQSQGAAPGGAGLPPLPGDLGGLPPPGLPVLPSLMPPILPAPVLPGQEQPARSFGRRSAPILAMDYGDRAHVFEVLPSGVLEHRFSAPGQSGRDLGGWSVERLPWTQGLAPRSVLSGVLFGGMAHVFGLLQQGGVLHLAQPLSASGAGTFGGEIVNGG